MIDFVLFFQASELLALLPLIEFEHERVTIASFILFLTSGSGPGHVREGTKQIVLLSRHSNCNGRTLIIALPMETIWQESIS